MERWLLGAYYPVVVLVFVGCVVFGVGYWLSLSSRVEVEVVKAEKERQVVVDIGGAVVRPGVYRLDFGSRVKDGLVAAGGLAAAADRGAIEQSFNLASTLKDGEKIYIPFEDHEQDQSDLSKGGAGKISINRASVEALISLAGIGESRALKIVENRPYRSLEELVERGVIGKKLFEEIRKDLVLW